MAEQNNPPERITKFQKDKYSISSHTYPLDLTTSTEYGGNYVIFNINVSVDSKLLNENGGRYGISSDQPGRDRGEYIATAGAITQSFGGGTAGRVATGTALVGGAVAGPALAGGGLAALGSGQLGSLVTGAAGLSAIGLGAAAAVAGNMERAQKRLETAIALHIPNQLNIRYGTQWSEEDTSTALMAPLLLGDAAQAAIGAATGLATKDYENMKNAGGNLASGVAALGLAFAPGAAAISAGTGLAYNPRKEQVFKGVDFRTFQFDYQFFPRSAAESKAVLAIIKEFKLHMHPEYKDANKFLWIYPSEFDIAYYTNGQENKSLHRHPSCVLTEMTVNYTPNGAFNTFADGTPTQINVQMTFRELALMDKERIDAGM
jgi:hypothetical protein